MMELDPDPLSPEILHPASDLKQAAGLLLDRDVIVYPTETFYGLLASALDENALLRIVALKGRSSHNPMPCIIGNPKDLMKLAASVGPDQKLLMDRFWPGPLTLIFDAAPGLSDILTGGTVTVGIRIPGSEQARALADIAGPLVATSANKTGQKPLNDPDVIRTSFPEVPVFGTRPLPGSKGSTVLDARSRPPRLIRDGDVSASDIEEALSIPLERGEL